MESGEKGSVLPDEPEARNVVFQPLVRRGCRSSQGLASNKSGGSRKSGPGSTTLVSTPDNVCTAPL